MLVFSLFLAPEILNGKKYTHAVDWWSLGVVMYTLLAGKVTLHVFLLAANKLPCFPVEPTSFVFFFSVGRLLL